MYHHINTNIGNADTFNCCNGAVSSFDEYEIFEVIDVLDDVLNKVIEAEHDNSINFRREVPEKHSIEKPSKSEEKASESEEEEPQKLKCYCNQDPCKWTFSRNTLRAMQFHPINISFEEFKKTFLPMDKLEHGCNKNKDLGSSLHTNIKVHKEVSRKGESTIKNKLRSMTLIKRSVFGGVKACRFGTLQRYSRTAKIQSSYENTATVQAHDPSFVQRYAPGVQEYNSILIRNYKV